MEVSFVPFDEVFLNASWNWLQDDELRQLIDSPQISKEQQQQWYNSLSSRTNYKIWGVAYNHMPVGVCGLKNITQQSGEYWGYIGEKKFWGKGIGRRMLAFSEAFAISKNIAVVYLKVLKNNERAISLYLHIGYMVQSEQDNFLLMSKTVIHA